MKTGILLLADTYTVSFWLKADKAGTITVMGKSISASTVWKQVSATFSLSAKTEFEMAFSDATYYVYQAQLEQGTFATAWQLSPEDVDQNTDDKVSASEQNTDKKIEKKNASFAQDTQPVATKIGDQWIDTAHDNAVYYWTGASWTVAPFGATAIAAEAIYARHIMANAITTEKLAAECITADKIAANAIQAKNIIAGSITADLLAAESVTAEKLHAGCITADKIVAESITTEKIASKAVTTNEIAANAITADKMNITGGLSAITADLGAITSGSLNIGSGNFVVDTAGNLTSKGTMSIGNGGITYTAANGLSVFGDIKVKIALKMYYDDRAIGACDGKEHYYDAMKITIMSAAPYLDVMSIYTENSATFNGGISTNGNLNCGSLTVSGADIISTINATVYNDSYYFRTFSANAEGHGDSWRLFCQHNLDGDGLFRLRCGNGSIGVKVDNAVYAAVAQKIVNYNIVQRTAIGTGDSAGSRIARIDTVGASGTIKVWGEWGAAGSASSHNIVSSSSDIRLKEHIAKSEIDALCVIDQIKIRQFDWKTGQHQKIGFIADELESIDQDFTVGGGYDEEGNPDYKSIDNLYLSAYIVKAIHELHQKIKEQQNMIYSLQFEIARLQA